MSLFIGKVFQYLHCWGHTKFEEKTDPKILIQQAIQQIQQNHERLTFQAALVISNQRQLEMKIQRQQTEITRLEDSIRETLILVDKATRKGNTSKTHKLTVTAEKLAEQLTTSEKALHDLQSLHENAVAASQQAKTAIERNSAYLQTMLNERTKLLNQLEQTKMQEEISKIFNHVNGLTVNSNTPSLEQIRNKIEERYTNTLGLIEIAGSTVQNHILEVQQATIQQEGQQKLEEIKKTLQ